MAGSHLRGLAISREVSEKGGGEDAGVSASASRPAPASAAALPPSPLCLSLYISLSPAVTAAPPPRPRERGRRDPHGKMAAAGPGQPCRASSRGSGVGGGQRSGRGEWPPCRPGCPAPGIRSLQREPASGKSVLPCTALPASEREVWRLRSVCTGAAAGTGVVYRARPRVSVVRAAGRKAGARW